MARAGSRDDPVMAYARSITEGTLPVNRLVRLACERHLNDLSHGAGRGLRFDLAAARHAIEFFGCARADSEDYAAELDPGMS